MADLKSKTQFLNTLKFRLAIPILFMTMADLFFPVIQLLFIRDLEKVEYDVITLGTSFCNVTGYSINVGLLSALDTLSSQAYGAKNYKKIGTSVNQSFFVLGITSILIFPIWMVSLHLAKVSFSLILLL